MKVINIKTYKKLNLFLLLMSLFCFAGISSAQDDLFLLDEGSSIPIDYDWNRQHEGFLLGGSYVLDMEKMSFKNTSGGGGIIFPQWIASYRCSYASGFFNMTDYQGNYILDMFDYPFYVGNMVYRDGFIYQIDSRSVVAFNVFTHELKYVLEASEYGREQVYKNKVYSVRKDGIYATNVMTLKTSLAMPINAFNGKYVIYEDSVFYEKNGIFQYQMDKKSVKKWTALKAHSFAVFNNVLYLVEKDTLDFYAIQSDGKAKKITSLKNDVVSTENSIAITRSKDNTLLVFGDHCLIDIPVHKNQEITKYYFTDGSRSNFMHPEKFAFIGESVYFADEGIYKVDLKNLKVQKVLDEDISSVIRMDDKIYYEIIDFTRNVYETDLELNNGRVVNSWVEGMYQFDPVLYKADGRDFYYLSTQFREGFITREEGAGFMNIHNETSITRLGGFSGAAELYKNKFYTTAGDTIYTCDYRGTNEQVFYKANTDITGLAIKDGYLYYSGNGLFKMDLKTKKVIQLSDDLIENILIVEDWILYKPIFAKTEYYYYKMRLDGSEGTKIQIPVSSRHDKAYFICVPDGVYELDMAQMTVERIPW